MSAQVLVIKPDTLSVGDKRKLKNAGVIAIETERPADVRLLSMERPPLDGDDLLFAALKAVGTSNVAKEALADHVLAAIKRVMTKGEVAGAR